LAVAGKSTTFHLDTASVSRQFTLAFYTIGVVVTDLLPGLELVDELLPVEKIS
jgi:hypothetical protein